MPQAHFSPQKLYFAGKSINLYVWLLHVAGTIRTTFSGVSTCCDCVLPTLAVTCTSCKQNQTVLLIAAACMLVRTRSVSPP